MKTVTNDEQSQTPGRLGLRGTAAGAGRRQGRRRRRDGISKWQAVF